eukprot:9055333-Pyramimonas_sp.AAC.1
MGRSSSGSVPRDGSQVVRGPEDGQRGSFVGDVLQIHYQALVRGQLEAFGVVPVTVVAACGEGGVSGGFRMASHLYWRVSATRARGIYTVWRLNRALGLAQYTFTCAPVPSLTLRNFTEASTNTSSRITNKAKMRVSVRASPHAAPVNESHVKFKGNGLSDMDQITWLLSRSGASLMAKYNITQ